MAFFWAKTNMGILLSGNLEILFVGLKKLWSQEKELYERIDVVDDDAILPLIRIFLSP